MPRLRAGPSPTKVGSGSDGFGTGLSDAALREYIDEKSLRRGEEYHRKGAVFDARRCEERLTARCTGTSAASYRVEATVRDGRVVKADCTCPVGDGGHCKHVAALLLTWRDAPDAFREVEDIRQALTRRSKEELIDLIGLMLDRQPDLEPLLELAPPAGEVVDSGPYRDRVAAVLRAWGGGWDEEYPDGSEPAGEVESLNAIGNRFAVAGDVRSAATVYRGLLEGLMTGDESRHEFQYELTDDLIDAAAASAEGLAGCLRDLAEDGVERAAATEALSEWLRFDLRLGGVGLSDAAVAAFTRLATDDEREELSAQLDDLLDEAESDHLADRVAELLLELDKGRLDDEAYLERCRRLGQTGPLIERLLALGRSDEAIAAAGGIDDGRLPAVADRFVEAGLAEAAVRLVRERLRRDDGDWRLRDWLERSAVERGDWTTATELAWERFCRSPSAHVYQTLRELAVRAGRWEDLKPNALRTAEKSGDLGEHVRMLLEEGEVETAVRRLRSNRGKSVGPELRRVVARAAEATHPSEAIALYWESAQLLILRRHRDAYREASEDLVRLRDLYRGSEREDEWNQAIVSVRDENRRLRALQEELRQAGL